MTDTIGRKYVYEGNHISVLIHLLQVIWIACYFIVTSLDYLGKG